MLGMNKDTLIMYAKIAAVAAAVVYLSNNSVPVLGDTVKKAIG